MHKNVNLYLFAHTELKKMRYLRLFFLLVYIVPALAVAQETPKPIVSVAAYFDISPPLRTMCIGGVKKADQSWKDGIVKNYFRPGTHYGNSRATWSSTEQKAEGVKTGDSILQNFDGISNLSWIVPPDPSGDAGPDHYFQMVNFACAIYNKTGGLVLGPFGSGTIWNGMPNSQSNGDGVVLYDENAHRWLISQLSMPNYPSNPFYEMIAVSQTPDPTGSWYRWIFTFNDLTDYPKFGIWHDGYYMSYNRIRTGGMVYDGTGAAVFDRAAMVAGDPQARMILFLENSANDAYSTIPADCDGDFPDPSTPEYFFFVKRNYLGVREFHTNWSNPSNSTFGSYSRISVNPYLDNTESIPQKGTGSSLNPINDRLMFRLNFRKFADHQSAVINHTVDVGTSTGIRWYELRRTTENWYLHQQSTYAPDSNFRWMGSTAIDQQGNIALGYSVSGSGLYPSVRYTGRMANDPVNQMTIAEREIIPGGGAQTGVWGSGGRWGDYSAMSVDPSLSQTFWYTQEYYDSTSYSTWNTRIASFSFAHVLAMHATASTGLICSGGSSILDMSVSGGTGNYTYEWWSDPSGTMAGGKQIVVSPVITTRYFARVSDGQSVCTDTLTITPMPLPSVFPGNDTSYCHYIDTILLQGSASNIISIKWTTTGDGLFSDETSLAPMYFPGLYDKSLTMADLKLTGLPMPPCSPVSSVKHITFEPCPGFDELADSPSPVEIFPNPSSGHFTIMLKGLALQPVSVGIFNGIGQPVQCRITDSPGSSSILQVTMPEESIGVFLVKVQTKETTLCRKIIVQ